MNNEVCMPIETGNKTIQAAVDALNRNLGCNLSHTICGANIRYLEKSNGLSSHDQDVITAGLEAAGLATGGRFITIPLRAHAQLATLYGLNNDRLVSNAQVKWGESAAAAHVR